MEELKSRVDSLERPDWMASSGQEPHGDEALWETQREIMGLVEKLELRVNTLENLDRLSLFSRRKDSPDVSPLLIKSHLPLMPPTKDESLRRSWAPRFTHQRREKRNYFLSHGPVRKPDRRHPSVGQSLANTGDDRKSCADNIFFFHLITHLPFQQILKLSQFLLNVDNCQVFKP